jgi:hypothetical protein
MPQLLRHLAAKVSGTLPQVQRYFAAKISGTLPQHPKEVKRIICTREC